MRALIAILFLISVAVVHADEIKLPASLKVGNVVYTGVEYTRHDAVYLTFVHESGIGHVKIEDLPKEVREMLGYDSRTADEQIQREEKLQAAAAANASSAPQASRQQRAMRTIHGKLVENTEKGLFVAVVQDSGRKKQIQNISGFSNYSNSGSSDQSEVVTHEESIYETVYFLVTGNPNAEYLKVGTSVDYLVSPSGADAYEGQEATSAVFVKSLK